MHNNFVSFSVLFNRFNVLREYFFPDLLFFQQKISIIVKTIEKPALDLVTDAITGFAMFSF